MVETNICTNILFLLCQVDILNNNDNSHKIVVLGISRILSILDSFNYTFTFLANLKAGTQTRLLQLPIDVLKHILLLVAMSFDGAKDIARVLSVSKGLMKLGMSKEILRAISFPQQLPSSEQFWKRNGLIIKSARARNPKPYRVIMKECNAKVKSGDSSNLTSEEVTSVRHQVRKIIRRTNLDIMKAESMTKMPLEDDFSVNRSC